MAVVRVQKYLSERGVASRRKAEELIEAGKVKVNGRTVKLGDKVDSYRDIVTVAGKRVGAADAPTYIMLNKTVYGRHLYCVGGNREAAKLSGIKVKKVIIIAYVISGFMGALSGLVLSSMNLQASAGQAKGYENDVLAAIVLGGVSLRGGSGTIQGAMFGTLLIGILTNGLQLLGVASVYHDLIKGLIIITAVAIDMYSSYKMSGLKRESFFSRLFKRAHAR